MSEIATAHAAELARQREVIAALVEALERITDTFERNYGRQSEKLTDIPRIARAALSRAQAGDGEGGEANG